MHRGFALVDVISPCVTFNDHEGSTKSYRYTRQHQEPVVEADFVPPAAEITADYASGTAAEVAMHDGGIVRFTKIPEGYDPTDRDAVVAFLREHQSAGSIPTGLLFLDPDGTEMHAGNKTVATPLTKLPYEQLCPGAVALAALQKSYR